MTPAFCWPPSIAGDRFEFEPKVFKVVFAPARGMSIGARAVVPAVRPGVLGRL